MRQLQGPKKRAVYTCEHTQDLNAVFNHLAVPLTQHGSLHVLILAGLYKVLRAT